MMGQPAWPAEREGEQIARALDGVDVEQLTLVAHEGSPWLRVDAWVHLEGERKLALWRFTGAVYRVRDDGAVEDDPFVPGAWSD